MPLQSTNSMDSDDSDDAASGMNSSCSKHSWTLDGVQWVEVMGSSMKLSNDEEDRQG